MAGRPFDREGVSGEVEVTPRELEVELALRKLEAEMSPQDLSQAAVVRWWTLRCYSRAAPVFRSSAVPVHRRHLPL
jgi:hypothetical protein